MNVKKSEELWKKGNNFIIHGTSLFSRGPRISIDGFAPKYSSEAQGCYFIDPDGNKFLDYGMGVGSVILGYGALNEAMKKQLKKGNNLSLLSPLQVELAEKLRKNIPSCEKLKYLSSGSEVTETAVRIARAFTEKDIIIRDEYHGWMSWCTPIPGGVPKQYYNLTIKNDSVDSNIENYKKHFDEHGDIACVILEPTHSQDVTKSGRTKFLNELKSLCHRNDSLLIFDEVACGYRFGLGGAQSFFDVKPDISAFGKSVGNGFPLSFVCTSDEIAEKISDDLFVSSTYGGNAFSLRAALETTKMMEEQDVSKYMNTYGERFKKEINKISKENNMLEYIKITGFPQRLAWGTKDWDIRSLLFQEFIRRNIFFTWEIKNSYAHREEDLQKTTKAYQEAINVVNKAIHEDNIQKYMEGEMIRPIL